MKKVLYVIILSFIVLMSLSLFVGSSLIIAYLTLCFVNLPLIKWVEVCLFIHTITFIALIFMEILDTYINYKKNNRKQIISECFKQLVSIGVFAWDIPILTILIGSFIFGSIIILILTIFI